MFYRDIPINHSLSIDVPLIFYISMADEPGEALHFPLPKGTIIHNLSEGVQVQTVFALKVLALAEFLGG